MDNDQYIVAAEVGTSYKGCIVAPADAMIVATHRKVFGPASKSECENWRKQNCSN